MTLVLNLDPVIVARAEAQAAREGTTLAQFVEKLVSEQLAALVEDPGRGTRPEHAPANAVAPESADQRAPDPLPVFRGGTGGARDIDWLSNASIYAAMYDEEDERMRRWSSGESREY